MSIKRKFVFTVSLLCLMSVALSASASTDSILSRWRKTVKIMDEDNVGFVEFTATYYSAEYIQALVQKEAKANLWTKDEEENYKYQLLKTLQLERNIPIFIEINNYGSALRMAPFGDQVELWINGKAYSPVDYDKRFNFKLTGKRDGFVYFPRYNEETGQSLLTKAKTVKFSIDSGVSPMSMGRSSIDFLWDVHRDNPDQFFTGKAAERLELDRLIIRLGNLKGQRDEIQKQLDELDAELVRIQSRIDELQSK
ncbi:hypothetical protein L2W58_02630 [Dethiosulfovibrio sp. F2B]|uniref:hypothetical protein n=1 Tax=Dethiosulfovibrio faecalis TaxID=2720018 RepID=UPI001F46CE69|nr:hypothetical protein [Dethiosulfovibrio faecalis]MCF4150686.1 hypothetical protein [Dethiosulfovibrio faecalis]